MDRSPPRAIISSITILMIIIVVLSLIVVLITLALGNVPTWALALLIVSLIALVIIRVVAMSRFGYPPYDSTKMHSRTSEQDKKK